jgi:hypothetical protein
MDEAESAAPREERLVLTRQRFVPGAKRYDKHLVES